MIGFGEVEVEGDLVPRDGRICFVIGCSAHSLDQTMEITSRDVSYEVVIDGVDCRVLPFVGTVEVFDSHFGEAEEIVFTGKDKDVGGCDAETGDHCRHECSRQHVESITITDSQDVSYLVEIVDGGRFPRGRDELEQKGERIVVRLNVVQCFLKGRHVAKVGAKSQRAIFQKRTETDCT